MLIIILIELPDLLNDLELVVLSSLQELFAVEVRLLEGSSIDWHFSVFRVDFDLFLFLLGFLLDDGAYLNIFFILILHNINLFERLF